MNELSNQKWYTIEELASAFHFDLKYLKNNMKSMLLSIHFNMDTQSDMKFGGYHNTQALYSQNVFNALGKYRVKIGTVNSTKEKEVVSRDNFNTIGQFAVNQAFNSIIDSPENLMTLTAMLSQKLAEKMKENEAQKQQLIEQQPKVDVYNRISESKGLFTINQTAKALQLAYGNKTFFKELVEEKILMDDRNHTPYQQYVNDGYFVVKTKIIPKINKSVTVTLVTPKGITWLAKRLGTVIDESVKADA